MNNPEEVTKLENDFAEEVKKRGDDFKYFKDQVSPLVAVWLTVPITEILSVVRRAPRGEGHQRGADREAGRSDHSQ